jgi:isopropylmalate/homocitrate/citramalate synthase
VLSPHGAKYFTERVSERIHRPLEVHFHADFGLGVANTIMSIMAGAETIHTTVTGIGERTGNTPMEETVLALLTLYGIDTGIKYEKLNELAALVRELSGTQIPSNRPFIGDMAYDIESGIVTSWYRNVYDKYPTELYPVHPDFVGHRSPQILMGKKSGVDNVLIWAEEHGIELSEDEIQEIVQRVKLHALERRCSLCKDEFKKIVSDLKG